MLVEPKSAVSQITGAIRQAARSTGAAFEYLLATARIESNLNPSASAATSSAKGLFQFIEQTWLGTLKQAGPSLGYGRYADAVVMNEQGQFEVPDPAMRRAIMKLRADPATSAAMAGAFTRNNAAELSSAIGRAPREGELYMAHFLGAEGAAKLIGAATTSPNSRADALFPQAAASNRAIFYDRAGRPRSARHVYGVLAGRYAQARAATTGTAVAQSVPALAQARAQVRPPDTAGVTRALAQADHRAVVRATPPSDADLPPVPDTKPLFVAMFTTRARQAVAPVVSKLWTPQGGPANSPAKPQPVRPLEFFIDQRSDARKIFGNDA